MQHLAESQNIPPVSAHGTIVNPTFHIELAMYKQAHVLH